jgi:hypothetical protein
LEAVPVPELVSVDPEEAEPVTGEPVLAELDATEALGGAAAVPDATASPVWS